jgi:hypothetical protein
MQPVLCTDAGGGFTIKNAAREVTRRMGDAPPSAGGRKEHYGLSRRMKKF